MVRARRGRPPAPRELILEDRAFSHFHISHTISVQNDQFCWGSTNAETQPPILHFSTVEAWGEDAGFELRELFRQGASGT